MDIMDEIGLRRNNFAINVDPTSRPSSDLRSSPGPSRGSHLTFDEITWLARDLLEADVSLISLLGDDFEWYRSARGTGEEGPR